MTMAKLRRMLFLGAMTGLTVMLSACEPEDSKNQLQHSSLLSDAALGPGWSMTDLAGLEPALLSDNYSEMPQALPMQASWDGGYDYAPAYDYAPYADEYYEPLDESYYAESSGSDDYLWLALAAALAGMLSDSPPDYAFGYDGIQPWAWETGDRYVRYAEPVYGGYRYYYYEPDAYRPFLVRDPYYSYGYRDDRLMVIYDRHGQIIDGGRARHQRLAARDYYLRGERLYRAGHQQKRFGVPAPLWDSHRDKIAQERREWQEARRDHDNWQRWDVRHRQRLHRDWAGEALLRRKAERGFASWQKADYRTPAPKFYTPENRRAQLLKVADIRRERAGERREMLRREEQLALVRRFDQDRARDRNRSPERNDRLERRGNGQSGEQVRRANLAPERDDRRADRAEQGGNRRAELRREVDLPQRSERAAERHQERATPRQDLQRRSAPSRQNAERQQRASVQKDRAGERGAQARQVERRRNEQQAQRVGRERQAAVNAEVRRERMQQQQRQEVRRQQHVRQEAARQTQQRRQVDRQQDQQRAQRQVVRQADARSQQQVRTQAPRARQDARRERSRGNHR